MLAYREVWEECWRHVPRRTIQRHGRTFKFALETLNRLPHRRADYGAVGSEPDNVPDCTASTVEALAFL